MRRENSIRWILTGVALMVLCLVCVGAAQAAAPPNDLCANAIVIPLGGSYSGSTLNATGTDITTCGNNDIKDVWFSFTSPKTTYVVFSTCGSALDTTVSVFDTCGGAQIANACNDDSCGWQSELGLYVTAAHGPYLVRVAGCNNLTGNYTLHIDEVVQSNDNCANAIPIALGETKTGSNAGSTNEGYVSKCSLNDIRDVWFSFTPEADLTARFSTCGSALDTSLSIFRDCTGGSEIICNDDDDSLVCGVQSVLFLNVTAYTTYLVRVAGYDGLMGNYSLNISTTVNFPDPGLDAAVRAAIGIPTGDIYTTDLVGLTSLTASDSIVNLAGLEQCKDLTTLDLGGNLITNISALAGLTKLTTLYLDTNAISDISALAGLTNLTTLYLDTNQISDITALVGLTNLATLYLNTNQISSISALVANAGINSGDHVYLNSNPLSQDALCNSIPTLDGRGVTVSQSSVCGGEPWLSVVRPVGSTVGGQEVNIFVYDTKESSSGLVTCEVLFDGSPATELSYSQKENGSITIMCKTPAGLAGLAAVQVLCTGDVGLDINDPNAYTYVAPAADMRPRVTVDRQGPNLTNTLPILFDVLFSEPVNSALDPFLATDVIWHSDGLPPGMDGTIGEGNVTYNVTNPSSDGQNYVLSVTAVVGDGTLQPSVPEFSCLDWATDSNWNWTSTFQDNSVTLDRIAPSAPHVTGTSSPTINKTPTWTWTSGGGGNGSYHYLLNGAKVSWTPTTDLEWTPTSDLAIGVNTLNVQERDDAGNWSDSGSYPITIINNTHTLTYTAGANGSLAGTPPISPQTVNHGASGTQVTAVPVLHYHFVQWNDAVMTAARTDTNVTADIDVTASFAIDTYTLTYSAGLNGAITGISPQTVNYGANGTQVTATPAIHYHFVQWSDAVMTAARTDTNVTANINVTATFAIDTHTLTYTAGANGSITGTPPISPQTVNHGANGTQVTATPALGYTFMKWSDNVMTAARTDTNVTANISVTAIFADITPPDVPEITGPNGGAPFSTNVAAQTITGECAPDTATVLMNVNGSPVVVTRLTTTTWSYPATLVTGANLFSVKAVDAALNESGVAEMMIYLDTTAPTMTINQAAVQADPTNTSPIIFRIIFSEEIDPATFDGTDVVITGTAGGTKTVELTTLDNIKWRAMVSGMTTDGTVIANIPVGAVKDLAGNANTTPAASTDNTVTWDTTPPTVTVEQQTGQADPTAAFPVKFDVVFSETIQAFSAASVTIYGTATGVTYEIEGSCPNYTINITGATTTGTIIPTIQPGACKDLAGNNNILSSSIDNKVTVMVGNAIVVTSPNGGETWEPGTHNIQWAWNNLTGNVGILLYDGSGTGLVYVGYLGSAPITSGNTGVNVTIPNATPGSNYRIRIISGSFGSYSNKFSIDNGGKSLAITAPIGGETWNPGTHKIQWTSSGLTGNVGIYLYDDLVFVGVLGGAPIASGTADVTIPNATPGSNYRIRILSWDNLGISSYSNKFTIDWGGKSIAVTSPSGGEMWAPGTQNIQWTWGGLIGNVNIYLYDDTTGLVYVRYLGSTDVTLGNKDVTIPAVTPGSNYRIRIIVGGFSSYSNKFTITP